MDNMDNIHNMLKANEVARLLNVHINTVRRWSNNNFLKAYRVGPRGDRRYKLEDVQDFITNNVDVYDDSRFKKDDGRH